MHSMTSIPSSNDRTLLASVSIIFCIFCIILATGCVSLSPSTVDSVENTNDSITPQSIMIKPFMTTPIPVQCQQESNWSGKSTIVEEPVIVSNPITDHHIGDIIPFGGTTTLAPGENITLLIYSIQFSTCQKLQSLDACSDSVRHCCHGISQTVSVKSNEYCINTWSWDVNTSQHQFISGSYVLVATSTNNPKIENLTVFKI